MAFSYNFAILNPQIVIVLVSQRVTSLLFVPVDFESQTILITYLKYILYYEEAVSCRYHSLLALEGMQTSLSSPETLNEIAKSALLT